MVHQALINSSTDLMWSVDKDYTLIAFNVFSLIAEKNSVNPYNTAMSPLFIIVGWSHCSSNVFG